MKKSVLVGFGALTLLALLLAPACALAAEWEMYGSARVNLFYQNWDGKVQENGYFEYTGDGVNDDTDLDMALQGNSRIGANVKASDVVSGRFEYGTGVNVRLLYGDWNFGSGTLRIGQDYTPMSGATSNQVFGVDDDLNSVGAVDGPRSAQIKMIMGGLQVALVQNQGEATGTAAEGTDPGTSFIGAGYTDTDIVIPKIEASYEFATDTISIMPFLGYQTFDAETTGTGQRSESVTSYVVGVHGRMTFGPAYVNFSGHYSQNGADYGLFYQNDHSAYNAYWTGTSVEDSTAYGCALVVGFNATDTLQLEAGVGYINGEVDTAPGVTVTDDTMAYYVNAVITLAPGVYIIPEIGMYDFGDLEVTGQADTDEGEFLYYGAKFQIDF